MNDRCICGHGVGSHGVGHTICFVIGCECRRWVFDKGPDPRDATITTLRTELAAARERERVLREALEPFAFVEARPGEPFRWCIIGKPYTIRTTIRAELIIAARAALAVTP